MFIASALPEENADFLEQLISSTTNLILIC